MTALMIEVPKTGEMNNQPTQCASLFLLVTEGTHISLDKTVVFQVAAVVRKNYWCSDFQLIISHLFVLSQIYVVLAL